MFGFFKRRVKDPDEAIRRFDQQDRTSQEAWKRLDDKLASLERQWRFP